MTAIPGLGNVFQNVLANGNMGNFLNGGMGLGGIVEPVVENFHTHNELGRFTADVTQSVTGGVLNAEGLGDAAGIATDFFTGNWFGAAAGAKDLLENFSAFDINKIGTDALFDVLDPSGNLKSILPEPPILKEIKNSFIGKTVESTLRSVGDLAKAIPDPGDLIGGLLGGGKDGGGLLGGILGGGKDGGLLGGILGGGKKGGGLLGGLLGGILGGGDEKKAETTIKGLGKIKQEDLPKLKGMLELLQLQQQLGGDLRGQVAANQRA